MKTQMPIGVDDAGAHKPIYADPAMQQAYREIGFDFFSWHIWGATELSEYVAMRDWADRTKTGFIVNQEGGPRQPGDPTVYHHPGFFYQPSREIVKALCKSRNFLGITYDEAEHWQMNGINVTGGAKEFAPHFVNADGLSLNETYQSMIVNLRQLMSHCYPGLADNAFRTSKTPIVMLENVFPVMMHLFARAGFGMSMKLLKESITPVQLGMALGACAQYHVPLWPCIDMWGLGGYQVNHKPNNVLSALRMCFYTGAQRCYVENFNYENSLYKVENDHPVLNAYADTIKKFRSEELPTLKRSWQPHDFRPEIAIIRFEDSDWGQMPAGTWITGNLYGNPKLMPDDHTRYWHRIWSLLMHQKVAPLGVNFNQRVGGVTPFNIFFPCNNAGVFDHTVSDPKLFVNTKLTFLTGTQISPDTMRVLHTLVKEGMVVVTPSHLAVHGMDATPGKAYTELSSGKGSWIVCDDVLDPEMVRRLAPMLGADDEFRLSFGKHKVCFKQDDQKQPLSVSVS